MNAVIITSIICLTLVCLAWINKDKPRSGGKDS